MEIPEIVAISTGDHKIAALFFDLIVPTHTAESVPEDVRYRAKGKLKLPYADIPDLMEEILPSLSVDVGEDERLKAVRRVDDEWAARVHGFFSDHGVASVPLFTLPETYERYNKPGENYGIEYTLTNAPIVSTADLDWDHVIEVRGDGDFRRKARALRRFLAKNYEGKNRGFIVDDIACRVAEYQESCRKHGLELVVTTLAKTLDSKSLQGSLAMTAAGIITGSPELTTLGAVGSTIEIGKLGLHIAEKKLQLPATSDDEALSYLIDLKNRTN